MTLLPDLEEQLREAAGRGSLETPRRSRWPRRLAAGLLVVPLVGTAAWAASELWTKGAEVEPLTKAVVDKELGAPLASTVRMSDQVVPDPDGGPPWGMRYIRTTRGYGCVQIGRIVRGELGVLGVDGAYNNDGRFHALRPDDLSRANCALVDGDQQTFLAVTNIGVPASASIIGTSCRSMPVPKVDLNKVAPENRARTRRNISRAAAIPACESDRLRDLHYGLLGPKASSFSFRAVDGRAVRRAVDPGTGAYLMVQRGRKPSPRYAPGWSTDVAPRSGWMTKVEYTDGTSCRLLTKQYRAGKWRCPRPGFVPIPLRVITPAMVKTDISVSIGPAGSLGLAVKAKFKARQPAVSGHEQYAYTLLFPRSCKAGGASGAIRKDVSAGETLSFTVGAPVRKTCRGFATGDVFYVQATGANSGDAGLTPIPPLMPGVRQHEGATLVGSFKVKLPN